MAQMQITISDALAAKIVDHWGGNAEWKDAVKAHAVPPDVPNPGKDEAVVTDANILDAVTAIVAPEPE